MADRPPDRDHRPRAGTGKGKGTGKDTIRVVVHAGFHKTGTTTVQRMLHANGPILWPRMALGLRWRLKPVLHAARGYSTWRDPVSLVKFRRRFRAYLDGAALSSGRDLCISSEELSGHLPGRGDLADYSAAPRLMREIARILSRRFGARLDLAFYLSTRAPGPWLQSAHAEHLKSSRMALDLDAFRARYGAAADLDAAAAAIAAAVAPWPVVTRRLEDVAGLPLGPAEPLIDLMNLPPRIRARLRPHPPENLSPDPALLAACLDINRGAADDAAARAAKDALFGRTGTGTAG